MVAEFTALHVGAFTLVDGSKLFFYIFKSTSSFVQLHLERVPVKEFWKGFVLFFETDGDFVELILNLLDLVFEVLQVRFYIFVVLVEVVNERFQVVRICKAFRLDAANHCRKKITLVLPFE